MARIKHGTLTADTVAVVDLPDNIGEIEVGIAANPNTIYFRVDGQDPTIGGDDCEIVPAGVGAAMTVDAGDNREVRLISAGTPTYWVRGV